MAFFVPTSFRARWGLQWGDLGQGVSWFILLCGATPRFGNTWHDARALRMRLHLLIVRNGSLR